MVCMMTTNRMMTWFPPERRRRARDDLVEMGVALDDGRAARSGQASHHVQSLPIHDRTELLPIS